MLINKKEEMLNMIDEYFLNISKEQFIEDIIETNCEQLIEDIDNEVRE